MQAEWGSVRRQRQPRLMWEVPADSRIFPRAPGSTQAAPCFLPFSEPGKRWHSQSRFPAPINCLALLHFLPCCCPCSLSAFRGGSWKDGKLLHAVPRPGGCAGGACAGLCVLPAGTATSLEPLITAATNQMLELILKPASCCRSGKGLPGTPALEHRALSPGLTYAMKASLPPTKPTPR